MADTLELPPRPELALFAYGLLQPGEPAYDLLAAHVVSADPASLAGGGLRVRDGLPLLDPAAPGGVRGSLLAFRPGEEKAAYATVCDVAARQHYRWDMTEVVVTDDRRVRANVLRGRHPGRGSPDEWFGSWSAAADPTLRFGMAAVRTLAVQQAAAAFPTVASDDAAEAWERFYALHATYLLLWAAVERFTGLAYGPAQPALDRTWRLGDDPGFRDCVVAAGVAASAKTADSRDPTRTRRIREDGGGAMFAWDAVRHLVAHPGRTAFADAVLLRRSLVDLHDTFRLVLLTRLPELAGAWRVVDPDGEAQRWLLRPVVPADSLR